MIPTLCSQEIPMVRVLLVMFVSLLAPQGSALASEESVASKAAPNQSEVGAPDKPAAAPAQTKPAEKPAVKPDAPKAKPMDAQTVEQIAAAAKPSVVTIRVGGRDGLEAGMGAGFVISEDGLIATNHHVIQEARPIWVQMSDGRRFEVEQIHAHDRKLDLAIIRIKAKGLKPLPLGDSAAITQGMPVVALGNPAGLINSVVSGVISAIRPINGNDLLQLAIPIEPGNSGGPVIDMQGRVRGIMNMKSLVTRNLGFAVPINDLKPLLAKPNPIPMTRWLTIGALDARLWKPVHEGVRWRQRAGRIHVSGSGVGFGGRAICLHLPKPAWEAYEVAVEVQLDDEAGAAGLVFASDGRERHYGFYPTNGQVRLTRFDGPTVFTWTILETKTTPHYRPGQFNHLKVRVEKDRILCFLNDHLVIESTDAQLRGGQTGLAKFRNTQAQFRSFHVAEKIPPRPVPDKSPADIEKRLALSPDASEFAPDLIEDLSRLSDASADMLNQHARDLQLRADRFRELASQVHQRAIHKELATELARKPADIDLFKAALLVARLDNPDIEIDVYLREMSRMAEDVKAKFPAGAEEAKKLETLTDYFFNQNGFHGGRTDYHNRSNSFINEVFDDREGMPITLSVIFMELGRRAGLNIVGVPLPGHFVVRHEPKAGAQVMLDPFDSGRIMTKLDIQGTVLANLNESLKPEHTMAATPPQIIERMLRNLLNTAGPDEDKARYLDAILHLFPDRGPERFFRAMVRVRLGRKSSAMDDARYLIQHESKEVDLQKVRQFLNALENENAPGN